MTLSELHDLFTQTTPGCRTETTLLSPGRILVEVNVPHPSRKPGVAAALHEVIHTKISVMIQVETVIR